MVGLVPDRSGCGPIELAVLQATDTRGANRSRRYVACTQVLPRIEERTGLGPRYAYDVLLDLARPWVIAGRRVLSGRYPRAAPRDLARCTRL